jgi:hypothetical protein
MKRVALVLGCLGLAVSLRAEKFTTFPHAPQAAPAFVVINGSPLTINIGDDTSFQVFNTNVPGGSGQIFPGGCTQTADAGAFADIAGTLYAPNFGEHPCGTATGGIGTRIPWTPVSLSAVTGNGSTATPFTVVVVVDAGTTGLRLTMTVTYVNGASLFNAALAFSNTGSASVTWNTFFGADEYLANNDTGIPYLEPGTNAPGGQDCAAQTYTILFLTTTPNDRYSANRYSTVWSEIGAGSLSNTVATGCIDNGAANEWDNRTLAPAATLTIDSGVSFSGFVGPTPTPTPPGATAVVPTLSTPGVAALLLLLVVVGYVLARKVSPGA